MKSPTFSIRISALTWFAIAMFFCAVTVYPVLVAGGESKSTLATLGVTLLVCYVLHRFTVWVILASGAQPTEQVFAETGRD